VTVSADIKVNLPWLTPRSLPQVEALKIRVAGGKPWHSAPAAPSAGAQPSTMWLAKYLAEVSGQSADEARRSYQVWYSYVQHTIERAASLDFLPYAIWWALEESRPQTDNPSQLFQWRQTMTAETLKGKALEREALLLNLADENGMPRAPSTVHSIGDITLNLLDRDAGALWNSWSWGLVPCFEPPVLTFWCPDPFTAKLVQHEGSEGKISALIQAEPPLSGKLNCGCLSVSLWLEAVSWRNEIGKFLSF
jgi:hypothetical protein